MLDVYFTDAEIVIASLEVDFEAPISLGDTGTVYTRAPDLGDSSFSMEYVIESNNHVTATAHSTIVPFDIEKRLYDRFQRSGATPSEYTSEQAEWSPCRQTNCP